MTRALPRLDRRRREIRQQHSFHTELVCEPTNGGDIVVITVWPSHEVFDTWIATPHRDTLTAREVHQSFSTNRSPATTCPADTSTCPGSPSTTQPPPTPEDTP